MAYTEFYCDPVNGSNLNAGSTNAAPVYTGVGDSDGTSVFTPSDGSTPANTVSAGMFASVYVTAGATVTVFVGRITNVAAGVNGAITVSTTAKSGTFPANSAGAHTISCVVGGYWLGPNGTSGFPFNFVAAAMTDASADVVRVNFKNSATYNITAAMTHTLAGPTVFQGFTTSPNDLGRATIDGGTSGASYAPLNVSGASNVLRDLIFSHNGATGVANGITIQARCTADRCVFSGMLGTGLTSSGIGIVVNECEAYGCNVGAAANIGGFNSSGQCLFTRCVSHDNSASGSLGFRITSSGSFFVDCIADTNASHGFACISANVSLQLSNCVAYNNGGAGLTCTAAGDIARVENCIFALNGTYGLDVNGATSIADLDNCAFFSNTSGQTNNALAPQADGSITLSGDPFVDAANGDFRLNSTAGAGAACRGAGRGAFVGTASYAKTTTGFPDVGAAQHQDGGGGTSGMLFVPNLEGV